MSSLDYSGEYTSGLRRPRHYSPTRIDRARKTIAWAMKKTGLTAYGLADYLFDSGIIPNTTGTRNARSGMRTRVRNWGTGKHGMNPTTEARIREIVGGAVWGEALKAPAPQNTEVVKGGMAGFDEFYEAWMAWKAYKTVRR